MKKIVQLAGAVAFACVAMAEETPQALRAERPGEWWMQRHDEKVAAAAQGGVDIVHIGDSITHYGERVALYGYYFGNRNVLNLGFGGDGTQNVLWRLQNGEIDGLSPKLVSIMIGTNNAGHDVPADVLLGIQAIVAELRQRVPDAEILLFSIFPRAAGAQHDGNVAVNAQLASLADGVHVFHMDINSHFLNPDDSLKEELYYIDLLHLSDQGYAVWWEQLEPEVSRALGDDPLPADPPRAALSTPRDGDRHQEKVLECQQDEHQLIFIGDSITHFWEREDGWGIPVWDQYYTNRHAFNLGFGGDTTDHVNWRLQNGEVEGLNPKVAVLMIGTNNTGVHNDDPADTVAGIESNIRTINHRLPGCKILLLSIFPRGAGPDDPLRLINDQVNQALPGVAAANPLVTHLDISDAFLDQDGMVLTDLMPDLLHPNTAGYQAWAEAMEPVLSQLLGDQPVQ